MPPKRVDEFDVYEFHVVVVQEGNSFIALGRDAGRIDVARISGPNLDDVRQEIRQILASKSEEYVGYSGAINTFLRAFPDGFYDSFFEFDERSYKIKAHEKAKEMLGRDLLRSQIDASQFSAVGESAKKIFINLIFPNEGMAFSSFLKAGDNARKFGPRFFALLYGDDFDVAFDDMVELLAPAGAAKWTILTYWPFILFPDRHMFMKPEVAQTAAHRLGEDFGYESRPSSRVYNRYLSFARRMREEIASLKPRDNIDVQTFMYAVGKPGFVREGVDRRARWIAKNNN